MNSKKNTHLGKKILYALVIAMSGLMMLICIAGVIGVWLVEDPIADASVSVLKVVENSSHVIRQANNRVDRTLAVMEVKTTDISNSSQQLSQNVNDKGLVMVLLPEEKELQLTETARSVFDTYNEIRESIAQGLDLYRSINRIPFVSLPGPSEDQMEKLDSGTAQIQALVPKLRSEITDIRSGVTGAIDKVSATADLLTKEIGLARDAIAQVDSSLAALEALSIRLQQIIPVILLTIAVILSLIFIFLIFTQVEVIRLYIERWRLLGQPQDMLPAETLAQPAQEGEGGSESE